MFKDNNPNYFYTDQGIRIFYNTNFNPNSFNSNMPVLVFNYGLICNVNHWKYQLAYFDQLGHSIITHDYHAHFSSSGVDEIHQVTFDNITHDLSQLLLHLNITKNVFMFGHSMGVNITLHFAKKYPEQIKGMLLISGTVEPPEKIMFDSTIVSYIRPIWEKAYRVFPSYFKKMWKSGFLIPLVRSVIYNGGFNIDEVPEEFIEIYVKKIGELDPELFIQLFNQMNQDDIKNDLQTINTSALIIGGDQDKVVPSYLQRELHSGLVNSLIYILYKGSHVPQVDFPDMINERILTFIESNRD